MHVKKIGRLGTYIVHGWVYMVWMDNMSIKYKMRGGFSRKPVNLWLHKNAFLQDDIENCKYKNV